MRAVAVATALLFIPAFMIGMVSIWCIVFGFLTAMLFHHRIDQIIQKCSFIIPKSKKAWSAVGYYFLLLFEMSIVVSLAPVLYVYSGWMQGYPVQAFDLSILSLSPLGFLKDGVFAQDHVIFQILQTAINSVFISFVTTIFLSFKKIYKHMKELLFYRKAYSLKDRKREITDKDVFVLYRAWPGFSVMFIMITITLYLGCLHDELVTNSFAKESFVIYMFFSFGLIHTIFTLIISQIISVTQSS